MSRVLISLVGGRPLPNILVALHLKPDRLYLVVSQDSLGPNGNYEKAVNALPGHLRPAQPYAVRPYVLQETFDRCQSIAEQHVRDEIIINSASEPKTMALGAYEIAKKLKAEGRRADLCYLARDGLVWVFDDRIETVQIGLQNYFAGYGWQVVYKTEAVSDKFKSWAALLMEHLPHSLRLLPVLRRSHSQTSESQIITCERLSDDEFELLRQMESLQIISQLQRDGDNASWMIAASEDGGLLLSGQWLEYCLYQTAAALKNEKERPLFHECGWGVKGFDGKGEIDFAGIFGGQILIASCKTEMNINRRWFEELHSKAQQLGKGMCSALLVTTMPKRTRTEENLQTYERWARERQIVLAFAEDIPKLPAILRKIVIADPKTEPLEIPCYPRI